MNVFYPIPQDLANTKSQRERAVKRTLELELVFFEHPYTITTCNIGHVMSTF